MRKSNHNRGPIAGFLTGVLFCFVGMSLILYLGWGFIKSSINDSKNNNDSTAGQSIPSDNNGETFSNDNASQPNTGVGLDGTTKPPLGESSDLDAYSALTYNNGQLGIAQGAGGMSHLKKVSGQYTSKEEYVHRNVHTSLMNMIFAANNDGISLNIVSAFRSYSHQKRIWENKWGDSDNNDTNKAKSILRYSSFPGTSRHHWGTDVDFNSVSLSFWQSEKGKEIHRWLTKNGPQFGFCQSYAPGRGQGYADEPWHWTHVATASQYYNQMSQPQILNVALSQNIKGAAAVRQMPAHMMSYITSVSGCRGVSSAPQQVNYAIETPRSGKKIPLEYETPQNNPNLKATRSPIGNQHSNNSALNNDFAVTPVYSDNTYLESNPKPPLPSDGDTKEINNGSFNKLPKGQGFIKEPD